MANVKFLKGTQSNFNDLTNFVDGAFYLTTDTDRLYFAQSANECVPLNQFIRTVTASEFHALTTTQVAVGDYYYIPQDNILAVCSGNSGQLTWTQLNPDHNTNTSFDNIAFSSTVEDNTVTVTEKLEGYDVISGNKTGQNLTGAIAFEGTNGIVLTAADANGDTTVTIEGDTYRLSGSMSDAPQWESGKAYHIGDIIVINDSYQRCKAEVSAAQNTSSSAIIGSFEPLNAGISLVSANGQASSTFGFKKGDNVTIGQTNGAITIAAKDTNLSGNNAKLKVDVTDRSNQPIDGFDITVSDSENNSVTGNLDPIVKIGSSEIHFVGGKAELPVYTTTEIDTKFKGLNGMTYKGLVGNAAQLILPSTNVSSGDTYMVAEGDKTIEGHYVKQGDLFIATGAEGADGFIETIEWTYVPSGDDSFENSTYVGTATPTSNTWGIKESAGQLIGDVKFVAGTNMSISSTEGGNDLDDETSMITTISHGSAGAQSVTSTTDTTPDDASPVATFTAVTGVGRDINGHVTSVSTREFDVKDTTYTFGAEVENNQIVTILADDAHTEQTAVYQVTSSSLSVATTQAANKGDITVNVELEWGTF